MILERKQPHWFYQRWNTCKDLGADFSIVPPWKIWRSLFAGKKGTRQKLMTTTLDLCFHCSLYTSRFVLTSWGRYLIHNGRRLLLLIYFLFIIFGIPWRQFWKSILFVCGCGGLIAKLCPTLCDPMNCSPWSSFVHGVSQARILERVAISFLRGSSWPRDQTQVSCTAGRFFTGEPLGKPSVSSLF